VIATGSADWTGSFHEGTGTISTASTTMRRAPYTFASRFTGAEGASPEELLAAAHAACYNHALANIVHKHQQRVGHIATTAIVDMGTDVTSPAIVGIRLIVEANLPDVSANEFAEFTQRAGQTCAISKALDIDVQVAAEQISAPSA
jgi:osmotically inducible protein OsmC